MIFTQIILVFHIITIFKDNQQIIIYISLLMNYYTGNLINETLKNTYYRKVLFTDEKFQLVLMSVQPKQELGMEIHEDHTQFIQVVKGEAMAILPWKDGKFQTNVLKDGDAIVIPSGTEHNIVNLSSNRLQLYSIYTPPEHK
jgi:mannose-6-phosphate isomerase-like protein (cupin superfamily)